LGNNLYAYCSNNSMKYIDTFGQSFLVDVFRQVKSKCTEIVTSAQKVLAKKTQEELTKALKIISYVKDNNIGNGKCKNLPDYSKELNKVLSSNALTVLYLKEVKSTDYSAVYFYDNVKPRGMWDYKRKEQWKKDVKTPYLGVTGEFCFNGEVMTAEDFGNIHFGYVGTALGFPDWMLFIGGGYASEGISLQLIHYPYFGDSFQDHINIQKGIDMYYKGIKRR